MVAGSTASGLSTIAVAAPPEMADCGGKSSGACVGCENDRRPVVDYSRYARSSQSCDNANRTER